ncbi:MAG TPA: Ni/Fe hydrogenase subunit alpha [Ktedonobacteraceae bacterium]|jgi:coenzyme F420-reducing hydrogenase alpha subunit
MKQKTIKVDALARVEGEGAFYVKIHKNTVTQAHLHIFEPPRFFEAFLRGRACGEAPDITARICGICPVAYQMSAVQAIEQAFGVQVGAQLSALRRLMYCGEWIESHTLHVYMLHAPDFLGYPDVMHMAQDTPDIVKRGLQMKRAGNALIALLGGREIHPVNVRVGGFYSIPPAGAWAPVLEQLKWGREAALATVHWVAQFPFPDFLQDYEYVALRHPHDYPIMEGRLVSNKGLDIAVNEYEAHFSEEQVPYSTALHSRIKERGAYLTGPLARYNLNFDRLSPLAQEAARAAGLGSTCHNPFQSIIVRSVEILYAFDEALRLIEHYEPPEQPSASVQPCASTGYACTEAPRGTLYHRYVLDDQGLIRQARIIPPTSQNQKSIENDLRHYVEEHLDLPEEQLSLRCEQVIRNYDPCISCATHFLKLHLTHV